MLLYHRTSLFESNAQTVVNTVNCVGVMGKGIAAEFKARYPDMFSAYKRICDTGRLEPGKLWLWQAPDKWVLNFPTKKHWRKPSRIEWIELGLQKFVDTYEARGITSISFPRLGCGNGNLDWEDVRPLMERYLSTLTIPVFVHDFSVDIGLPEHLEVLKSRVNAAVASEAVSQDFMSILRKILAVGNPDLADRESHQPFTAEILGGDLVLSSNGQTVIVENEDLKGIWLALIQGHPVTDLKARWAAGEGSGQLMSLLSLAPGVRAVQVQEKDGKAEFALERAGNRRWQIATLH